MWCVATLLSQSAKIGDERAIPRHLMAGEEFSMPLTALVEYGKKLFTANWTDQDGAGRPLSKGTGARLTDTAQPLNGLRTFNRISGPDANSCQGCHRAPYSLAGGSGDFVANVFVESERFDFVTFDRTDKRVTRGSLDERGREATLQTVGNSRVTPGLFGAGYLEMLARRMTEDLQRIRDAIEPGQSKRLTSKGISFGRLTRRANGSWDTSRVDGLPAQSLRTTTSSPAPSLIINPWHQSGSEVSLRQFTNTAFNRHFGIQSSERFGVGTDPDGDGVVNELTRADVTAVTVFQATLPVPGRVIPNDPEIEEAIASGERVFTRVGCARCHVPALALKERGWIYTELGPSNPTSNLRQGTTPLLAVDLASPLLPAPRLTPTAGESPAALVAAYTDFKLHDITDPSDPSAAEPIDMNQPRGSAAFAAGNRRFLTRRLWGVGNQGPYFHHGLFTTIREAVLAHAGEALGERRGFNQLSKGEQEDLLDFLSSLQVLPPGTVSLTVDEKFQPKVWPRK
jgi:mono/diheme cytochrome c family protein